jgi:hypothetical protein
MHDERIVRDQPSVEGTHLPADVPVAREQEAATNHIHCADDDGGARRIGLPFAIVGQFASKGANGERRSILVMVYTQLIQRPSNPAGDAGRIERLQRVAQLERLVCRLIHDCPPVDHIDQPPRQPHLAGGGLLGKRNQPDR